MARNTLPKSSRVAESASFTPEAQIAQQSDARALPALGTYVGIFSISAAVLLFELSLTRIFAVMLWSNLAFLVVSTALFGFGLSGVYLALGARRTATLSDVARYCLYVALAIVGSYLVISYVPFRMWQFRKHPENYLAFAVWETALLVPFFFAGLAIASCLSRYPRRAGRLYGVDLLGAAVGSLLIAFLVTPLTAEGTVVAASMLALLASLAFSDSTQRPLRITLAALFVLAASVLPKAEELLPIRFHQHKRNFGLSKEEPILATRWSTLSRVDIAEETSKTGPLRGKEAKAVWIDGGTNESVILKVDGSAESVPPLSWLHLAAAHELKHGSAPRVLIIGAAGGRETLTALSYGAGHVDAVEMDPSIVHFVTQPDLAAYMGGVYQSPRVSLINDEGRSFLRRTPKESYDIIQSVNNYTPVAMAAGALNLSETFLITSEAFHDYLDHLTPNGVVALHRGASIRVALTAIQALRERGVERPEEHILVANGEHDVNQVFLLKKSPWTREEIDRLHTFLSTLFHYGDRIFLFNPYGQYPNDPYYEHIITGSVETQRARSEDLGLDLTPATDDRPFLEHFSRFGVQTLPPGTPLEFKKREAEKWNGIIPRGDFPYVAILVESAVLALLFVGAPLLLRARSSRGARGFWGFAGFFSSLGFSFILVEICLMKRYVLFLGHPAYSVTTVLVVLLCGAGVGSMLSERIREARLRAAAALGVIALCSLLLAETYLSPFVFERFLGLELSGRMLVSAALLFPLGVCMGMPFTIGMRLIARMHPEESMRRELVAWAWGLNGYTTVIGSAATIYLALFYGFHTALLAAAAGYLLGLGALLLGTRRLGAAG